MLSSEARGIALSRLLSVLGPAVADLVTAPAGTDPLITNTAFEDLDDELPITPGGLLMLVGAGSREWATLPSLARAAGSGFAAVAVKRRARALDALAATAAAAGLAVIAVADEIPWRHLDALVSSTLSAQAEPDDQPAGSIETLFSIANAVAAAVGGPAAIENLGRRVLAYSNIAGQRVDELRRQGILDRRVPPTPTDHEQYRLVLASEGVVHFPEVGAELARAACAIRAGSLPLGTLWAIEPDDGIPTPAERAIVDGARMAALHLLRAHDALDLESRRRGEALRVLLGGMGAPDAAWTRVGLGAGARTALIAIAPEGTQAPGDSLIAGRVAHEVSRVSALTRPDVAVAVIGTTVYALIAGPRAGAAAAQLAEQILAGAARAVPWHARAAVSSEQSGPAAIPQMRKEVDQILRVCASGIGTPAVATMADVQGAALLVQVRDDLEGQPELRQLGLQALRDHDLSKGTELTASLLAWFEAQGNVRSAATRLHIHPNSLRYRIRRAQQVAGLDLSDPDQRLAVWLELRLTPADRGRMQPASR